MQISPSPAFSVWNFTKQEAKVGMNHIIRFIPWRINKVMRWGMKSACYRPITSGAPRSGWISTRGREYNHAQRNTSFLSTRCWWMEPCENLYIIQFNLPFTCLLFVVNGILVVWLVKYRVIFIICYPSCRRWRLKFYRRSG